MEFNSTVAIQSTFGVDPTEHYRTVCGEFASFHKDPINVGLHLLTTPIGLIGAFSLLSRYTKSSSTSMALIAIYLLSLLPAVPNGVFAGTALLCLAILFMAKNLKLSTAGSIAFIAVGYLLQDLSHMGTGEATYQASYSNGGHIDLSSPIFWASQFLEHCYYLLPLVVHISLPFLYVPEEIKSILEAPLPVQMQRLHGATFIIGPLICFAIGSCCLDSKNAWCYFPGMPYFYRVIQCSLLDTGKRDMQYQNSRTNNSSHHESQAINLKLIREWAMSMRPSEDTSSHYWFRELQPVEKQAFHDIATCTQVSDMFRQLFSERNYCLDVIPGMNEVYVTGPERSLEAANSDNVFYSRHVDGPFGLFPFVSVYRCIVGMDRNNMVTTHYPLAGIDKNACEGDVIAFDFNREVHYISRDDSKKDNSDQFRVVLKLHYCVYPRIFAPFGWLMSWMNTMYNLSFRALFLKTIDPQTPYEHFLAWQVNLNTYFLDRIETLVGQRNMLYLMLVVGLWYSTGVYEVFFALTSFVHYFRYITTFYVRKGIDFGSFKRDVLVFKSLALAQMFYHYFWPTAQFVFDPVSILMVITGYSVSVMATNAIGIDRTYFAAELGLCEPKWITAFPYDTIPHPMIVSQVFALLGLYKAAHFRTDWPYVVPIHIALYLTHMAQEHFDIYKHYPEDNQQTKITATAAPNARVKMD